MHLPAALCKMQRKRRESDGFSKSTWMTPPGSHPTSGFGARHGLPKFFRHKKRRIVQNDAANWWTRRGSNPRPLGCEPNALPAELRAHVVDLTTIPQQGKIVKLVLKKVRRCCSAWKSGRRTPGKRDPGSRQRPLSCLPGQEYCAGCKAEVWKHAAAFAGIKQFRATPHNSRLAA